MNYGKKNAAKKKWQLTSRGTVMRQEGNIADVADHSVTAICASVTWLWRLPADISYVEQIIAEAPDINEIDATPSGYMSTVLDAEGNVTAQLVGTGSNQGLCDIGRDSGRNCSKHLWQSRMSAFTITTALICGGLPAQECERSDNRASSAEGASTITQQLTEK